MVWADDSGIVTPAIQEVVEADGSPQCFAPILEVSNTTLTDNSATGKCTITNTGGSGNSFETIAVPAGTNPVADSSTDTLTITETSFLTLTGTAATDTIDITQVTTDLGTDGLIAANAVALGTDTTNNYVATIADAGNANITVANSGTETAAVTLDVVDVTCTDCLGVTEIADSYVLNTTDTMSGALTVGGLLTGSANVTVGNGLSAGTISLLEGSGGGTNVKAFASPATITADTTCTFEDDANFIPDSCVGDGSDAGGTDTNADKEFYWPASSLLPLEAADSIPPIAKDAGTNLDLLVVDFDQSTDECRTVTFITPPDITAGGTVTFGTFWYAASVTTNNIIMDFRHNSGVAEGVDPDAALTTEASVADAVQGTAGQVTLTTWTETQTNLGWAASDLVVGEFCRDADNESDNFAADSRHIGFFIRIPRS